VTSDIGRHVHHRVTEDRHALHHVTVTLVTVDRHVLRPVTVTEGHHVLHHVAVTAGVYFINILWPAFAPVDLH